MTKYLDEHVYRGFLIVFDKQEDRSPHRAHHPDGRYTIYRRAPSQKPTSGRLSQLCQDMGGPGGLKEAKERINSRIKRIKDPGPSFSRELLKCWKEGDQFEWSEEERCLHKPQKGRKPVFVGEFFAEWICPCCGEKSEISWPEFEGHPDQIRESIAMDQDCPHCGQKVRLKNA